VSEHVERNFVRSCDRHSGPSRGTQIRACLKMRSWCSKIFRVFIYLLHQRDHQDQRRPVPFPLLSWRSSRKLSRLATHRGLDMDITECSDARPVARRPCRVAPHHKAELNRELDFLMETGIIRKNYSPYASPCLFTPKEDGSALCRLSSTEFIDSSR
jgi:hypothetical protein